MEKKDDLLRIGVVTTTHGIAGEVKVFPTTDDVNRYKKTDEVVLVTKNGNLLLHIERARFFKNLVIVKFKEFNNINEVEGFRKCDLMVTRENALPLEEGQYYLCEEDDSVIGEVKDVIETGANNVFAIALPDGREVLFPVIDDCIKEVNTEEGRVVAHVMKGLMDE